MTPVVYDAGVLVAADRNVRAVRADHRVRLEAGIIPVVPAPVVAQASRSAAQVQLRRLLRGCDILPLTEQQAHAAGELMGRAATRDIVDAVVARTAADLHADVITGDRTDNPPPPPSRREQPDHRPIEAPAGQNANRYNIRICRIERVPASHSYAEASISIRDQQCRERYVAGRWYPTLGWARSPTRRSRTVRCARPLSIRRVSGAGKSAGQRAGT
jgi:predicted nucleic acid-binding protein